MERDRLDRIALPASVGSLRMSGASRYAARPVETVDWSAVPTVVAAHRGGVVHGVERWSGPEDLSLSWQAVQVKDALVLRLQVTDDVLDSGDTPAHDHVEIDLGFSTDGPPVRIAALHRNGVVTLRRWRWDGREVDVEAPGSARWARTLDGYEFEVRLPVSELPRRRHSGDLVMALRASDGEEGQTVLASPTVLTLPRSWPPSLVEEPARD